jgi:hypothetical protein
MAARWERHGDGNNRANGAPVVDGEAVVGYEAQVPVVVSVGHGGGNVGRGFGVRQVGHV